MINNHPLTLRNVASIGEEIGYELGKKMVLDYQDAHPADIHFFNLGRNIIESILGQPGCVGIRFYNAYDENGIKTLVYVGLDNRGTPIFQYTAVNFDGSLENKPAIVADRIDRGSRGGSSIFGDDWAWDTE